MLVLALLGSGAATLAAALAVAPASLEVALDRRLQGALPQGTHLVLRSGTQVQEHRVSPNGSGALLQLASFGPAQLSCGGNGVWCPVVEVDPATTRRVSLPIYSAASLKGRLVPPRGSQLPKALVVQTWLRSSPAADSVTSIAELPIGAEGNFTTQLPRIRQDLRLSLKGFAPLYRWDLVPGPGAVDLGSLPLHPGGSVSGLVIDPATEKPTGGVRVVAALAGAPTSEGPQHIVQPTAANGFFQLSGLAPGKYRLQLQRQGHPTTMLEGIEVEADAETRLDEVRLDEAASLRLVVKPPRDPRGKPWKVQLISPQRGLGPISLTVNANGAARSGPLAPGRYRVIVTDGSGSQVVNGDHEVTGETVVELEIPLTRLVGTVSIGEKPLAAELTVWTGQGEGSSMNSDADGRFEGWIPTPRRQWLQVGVRSQAPAVSRELEITNFRVDSNPIEVALRLGDHSILGTVVDEEGRPVPDATVRAKPPAMDEAETVTDSEGRFAIHAVEAQRYWVFVQHDEGAAEPVEVNPADESTARNVRLVLRRGRPLSGVVLSAEGQPVPNAKLLIDVPGYASSGRQVRANERGIFQERIPRDASHVLVRVMAPSQVLWSSCLRLSDDADLRIELPPRPGGTVQIRMTVEPGGPTASRGELVLYTQQGGFLTRSDLVAWNRSTTGDAGMRSEGNERILQSADLARGAYAVGWTERLPWELAAQLCYTGPPSQLAWENLGPQGQIALTYDVRPMQRSGR